MSDSLLIPADKLLPNKLEIIPLEMRPIFPGIFTPLMIVDKADVDVVEASLSTHKVIGLILMKSDETGAPVEDEFYKIGTAAKIVKKINLPDGGVNIFISTLKRFKVKKLTQENGRRTAVVEYLEDVLDDGVSNEIKAMTRSIFSEMKMLSENNPLFSEEIRLNMANIDQPGKLADFISSILNVPKEDQQKVLETLNIRTRMMQVLMFIKKEQELVKLQKKINREINDKIEKNQRDFFLREQLKAIKKELGISTDAKGSDYERFKKIIDDQEFTGEIKSTVESELEKFNLMDPNSSEFIVTRNYLETITKLPWKEEVPTEIDLFKAQKILDADHYGLEDVKKRIIEYLAVRKLKNDTKGSIVCLLGPPGVGKTSIGKSIARALGREFFRFSVGGMRDEAEIKGHRRTYVGAMPGKIIQGLKIVGTKFPVFMIDEIDKLGASHQGDPSSALLEVLDPEQNVAFRDNYLDLPFDISHILFIATANSLDTIPQALMDRMEVIRLSGYIEEEKVSIAQKYLVPKSTLAAGLKKSDVKYKKPILASIARQYAREAGLRNFEKALDKIHRKIATAKVLEEIQMPVEVDETALVKYLGKPIFTQDEEIPIKKPGLVLGLAWTAYGGATLTIEAVKTAGKGSFKLTGRMGDVMKESASLAYTWVHTQAHKWHISEDFFEKRTVHLHIPEGATPKDGPSAGVTMATAFLSLATGRVVKKGTAMTGELSLTGRVMAIGGLKEKVIAARRAGVKEVIFPKSNLRDWEEIPDYIRKGLSYHPVETMDEITSILLGEPPEGKFEDKRRSKGAVSEREEMEEK